MFMIWIWLAVIALGLIVEVVDAGTLVSVWFSVGAVIPFLMSIWRTNNPFYITAQVVVFGVVTALALIFLRKIALKVLYKNNEKTNMDRFVDKSFKVLSVNEDKTMATVKINGITYTAIGENETDTFEPNDEVCLKKFVGNKVVVYKKEKK